jgi:SUMO ligase MMS21 Smc5/6 complex component
LEDVFSRAAEQNVNEDIVEQDERYKQFRKQIYEINRAPDFKPIRNDEDDELEVIASQSTIDVYDPFTKSVMEEPYKNRKCGHSYEKSSIEEVLKRSRGKPVDCPVVGCRQTIANMNDLEPNLHLQVAIRRKQKNKERGMEKDVTDDAIDIDED